MLSKGTKMKSFQVFFEYQLDGKFQKACFYTRMKSSFCDDPVVCSERIRSRVSAWERNFFKVTGRPARVNLDSIAYYKAL